MGEVVGKESEEAAFPECFQNPVAGDAEAETGAHFEVLEDRHHPQERGKQRKEKPLFSFLGVAPAPALREGMEGRPAGKREEQGHVPEMDSVGRDLEGRHADVVLHVVEG